MKSYHLLQAQYYTSKNNLLSAKHLILQKAKNMMSLVHYYIPYRIKHYPEQARQLNSYLYKMKIILKEFQEYHAVNRKELFIYEARLTKIYWKCFCLIIEYPNSWKRIYPNSNEPINKCLNIGYSILGNVISKSKKNSYLTQEIGILHAPKSKKKALVYNMQELFRQYIVDKTVISYIQKTHYENIDSQEFINKLKDTINHTKYYYSNSYRRPYTIISGELISYKKSITENTIYKPHNIQWYNKKRHK